MTKLDALNRTISKMYLAAFLLLLIIVILAGLYITKPSGTQAYNQTSTTIISQSSNTKYQSLLVNYTNMQNNLTNVQHILNNIQHNLINPQIKHIVINETISISGFSQSFAFYNSTYNLYNNITENGWYNKSFQVPNDGYLIIYIKSVSAPVGTWSFAVNSNSSDYELYYTNPYAISVHAVPQNESNAPLKPTSGFSVVPDKNTSFYQIMPILRGTANFSFQNTNKYPIIINYSLVYVGEQYTNLTQITINYSH